MKKDWRLNYGQSFLLFKVYDTDGSVLFSCPKSSFWIASVSPIADSISLRRRSKNPTWVIPRQQPNFKNVEKDGALFDLSSSLTYFALQPALLANSLCVSLFSLRNFFRIGPKAFAIRSGSKSLGFNIGSENCTSVVKKHHHPQVVFAPNLPLIEYQGRYTSRVKARCGTGTDGTNAIRGCLGKYHDCL